MAQVPSERAGWLGRAVAAAMELRARTLVLASHAPGYAASSAALDRDRRSGGGLLAGALAFRLFAALLPLALLIAVGLGYAATVDAPATGDAAEAVGIRGALLESFAESSELSSGTRWTVAFFGACTLLWSAMAAARAIRAAHTLAWTGHVLRVGRAPQAGLVLIAGVIGFVLVWGAAGWARERVGGLGGVIVAVAAVAPFFAIWMAIARLLPHDDAPSSALVPGALLVAVGMQVIHLGTVLFVAGRVERASATYGSFGAALTLLVWLYVISRVIVASAMLNAALWQRRRSGLSAAGAARVRA